MKDGLYTTAEAAKKLNISKSTLLRRVAQKDIVPDSTDLKTNYHRFSGVTLRNYQAKRFALADMLEPGAQGVRHDFRFIDLFAGIGGIRLGFEAAGGRCVFTSEIDKYASKTYRAMFPEDPEHRFAEDITQVDVRDIPEHDVLLAGFPCQPFSIAGVSKYNALGIGHGFNHATKGTLFFDIARILHHHRPKAFFLENVKNLKGHDRGNTWNVIRKTLEDLGYDVYSYIYDAQLLVPQHRERIFIVGFRKELDVCFSFPEIENRHPKVRDILEEKVDDRYTLTDHLWGYLQQYAEKHKNRGNGFGYGIAPLDGVTRTLSARYYKDGSEILIEQKGKNPRRLTPAECARLQGFPERFEKTVVSDTQAYKQFGNAVAVPLIERVACHMINCLFQERI